MNKNRMPDLIDLYIIKEISTSYTEIDNIDDLSSNHVSVTNVKFLSHTKEKKNYTY